MAGPIKSAGPTKSRIIRKNTGPSKSAAEVDPKTIIRYKKILDSIRVEIGKAVIGQRDSVTSLLKALLLNAHVLVEGVPGIAKTLLIKTLAVTTGCQFKRIQFTVDLLPTDITGITAYNQDRGFYVVKGPIFANFVLADEINRAPPKTQSALLEAMQERQVTIGKETFPMIEPFFVMATMNPLEQSGVYELPEAQVDRFLFKLMMGYPKLEHEKYIIDTNMTTRDFSSFGIKSVTNPKEIVEMQEFTKTIFLSDKMKEYIVRIVDATRYPDKYKLEMGKFIDFGASPRATIGIAISAKAQALVSGEGFVRPQHIKDVCYEVLRHRVLLTYEGLARKINTDEIIGEILKQVPVIISKK